MRDPLLAPSAALMAGILLTRITEFRLMEAVAAAAAFTVLAFIAKGQSRRVAIGCGLLAVMAAGALVAEYHRMGSAPLLDTELDEPVLISGCVSEPPVFFEDNEQFILALEPDAKARVSLYVKEGAKPPDLHYGQMVELEARVRRPRNFHNPGSFDYATYLARRNIYWTAAARTGAAVRILPGDCGSRALSAIYAARSAVLARIDQIHRGDEYSSSMMRAILLGESSRLEKAWIEHFRRTGTYHALVISGLHVTVLAAVLLFLLRICLTPPAAALFLTSLAAWVYALMAGWSAPVVRAAAGLTLYLVARLVYRRGRILNLLAAVVIAFLLIDPGQLFEASFQLTFLSVAAIGALAAPLIDATSGPLARGMRGLAEPDRDLHLAPGVAQFRVEMRLLAETVELWARVPARWTAAWIALLLRGWFFFQELLIVSAAVQVGLVLPMAIYFHRLSLSGLSANLMVVPLMTLVVPVGFAAALTEWSVLTWFTRLLLKWSEGISMWHASWEPNWRVPQPPLWLALMYAAALIALAFSVSRPRWRRPAGAAALAVLVIIVWHPFAPAVGVGLLEMTAIDVGQGDSILVAFPDGRLAVIDAGGFPSWGRRSRSRLDTGEDVVSPYLWSRSIKRLDLLVLTHDHEDHAGGLPALIDNYSPRELWIASAGQALLDKARERGTVVRSIRTGQRFEFGAATVDVLAPDEGPIRPNDDSVVLKIRFGERSFLLTGEIEKHRETIFINGDGDIRADVLKVAHHGSRTSSNPAFLDRVRPSFAIISAGAGNSYGHPHKEVVDRLQERGAAVLRTDVHGVVSVRTDGRRLWADTWAWGSDSRQVYAPF